MLAATSLAVRFALELAALAALAVWGVKTGDGTAAKLALGIGAPLVAAVVWGLFVAPRATYDIAGARLAGQVLVFGAAALALVGLGRPALAAGFAAAVVADAVLMAVAGA
jgi:Protein of unknown function (DUF2568)